MLAMFGHVNEVILFVYPEAPSCLFCSSHFLYLFGSNQIVPALTGE